VIEDIPTDQDLGKVPTVTAKVLRVLLPPLVLLPLGEIGRHSESADEVAADRTILRGLIWIIEHRNSTISRHAI
jgi:hypothetical protein